MLKSIIIKVSFDLLGKARYTSNKTAPKFAKIRDDVKANNVKMNRLHS